MSKRKIKLDTKMEGPSEIRIKRERERERERAPYQKDVSRKVPAVESLANSCTHSGHPRNPASSPAYQGR
jgi:hypothetical protein